MINISRVPDQNGVSLLYIMLEIYHSGTLNIDLQNPQYRSMKSVMFVQQPAGLSCVAKSLYASF